MTEREREKSIFPAESKGLSVGSVGIPLPICTVCVCVCNVGGGCDCHSCEHLHVWMPFLWRLQVLTTTEDEVVCLKRISPPSLASNILSLLSTSGAPVAAHSLVITQIGIDGAGFRHLPLLKLVNSFVFPEQRSRRCLRRHFKESPELR